MNRREEKELLLEWKRLYRKAVWTERNLLKYEIKINALRGEGWKKTLIAKVYMFLLERKRNEEFPPSYYLEKIKESKARLRK